MNPQITEHHRSKAAYVYVRQSTLAQVRHHQESTERQYALREKALELGWSEPAIRILDRDLGISGAQTTGREDFKTLVAEVSMGQVGAVFALEVSRLARSNLDWHRLLELCALTETLVIDEDGCYNPADFNDGLLLGLNRPETQSTSYSTFCWTTSLGSVVPFRTGAPLASVETIPPADIPDVLTGVTPAKGAAQAGTIERRGDFCIRALRRHSVNPGNGFCWRFQRALSRCSPLYAETRYRARTPMNLHLHLPRLAAPIHLYGFDCHAQ
jgi:Resolvase, N terminal domain